MRKISPKIKEQLLASPFMKKCCLTDAACKGRIEFHHNMIYAGKQVDEVWAILPLCHGHHLLADHRDIKECLDFIMLQRTMPSDWEKYPRYNFKRRLDYLEKVFCK